METIGKIEQDYADFLESYVQSKGSSVGADAIWRQYKSEQVFPAGVYNPQRQDWSSWMAENAGMAGVSAVPASDKMQKLEQLQAQLAELRRMRAETGK
jgi:hypothetical protein